jgi:phospholipase/lecithinase/hemolysin
MTDKLRIVLRRRAWLAALLTACTLMATGVEARAATLGTLNTFGDSYTQAYWRAVPSWVTQLRSRGSVAIRANYARAGATASGANLGRATFDGQVDEWERAGRPQARRTIVYFGYNDINRRVDLGTAARAYAAGVDRLIRGRANRYGRKVLLTVVHDWSRNPSGAWSQRARVSAWNRHVRSIAAARGLRVIDVHGKVNAVFRAPRSFGISNTRYPSRTNPGHLFFDSAHFGLRGQRIIADTMRRALAR